jgi:hypothetical protein
MLGCAHRYLEWHWRRLGMAAETFFYSVKTDGFYCFYSVKTNGRMAASYVALDNRCPARVPPSRRRHVSLPRGGSTCPSLKEAARVPPSRRRHVSLPRGGGTCPSFKEAARVPPSRRQHVSLPRGGGTCPSFEEAARVPPSRRRHVSLPQGGAPRPDRLAPDSRRYSRGHGRLCSPASLIDVSIYFSH